MTSLQILRPDQPAQWMEVLAHSFQYDFYHLPQYHALAEERGEGRAHLFLYQEGAYFIALPLLLRPIEAVLCHAGSGKGYWDASCVYGYAGPIASHSDIRTPMLRNFQSVLQEALRERHIAAVFSRLHPLLPQRRLLNGLGESKSVGKTVSIDLTLPVDVQRARYRKNHKRDINRLRHLGAICLQDHDGSTLDEFTQIYHETMCRANSFDMYLFERSYFKKLVSTLASQMHLFVCLLDDRVICGGLFASCDGIFQYHLGGTRSEFLHLSPMKLLLDAVRLWANERQAHVFHLGGGVGARGDSLFHFKAGFSDRVHAFNIWRWVLLPDVYDLLCEETASCSERPGLGSVSSRFFPGYRCQVCPRIVAELFEGEQGGYTL